MKIKVKITDEIICTVYRPPLNEGLRGKAVIIEHVGEQFNHDQVLLKNGGIGQTDPNFFCGGTFAQRFDSAMHRDHDWEAA